MKSFTEFLNNISMLHNAYDLFCGYDSPDDESEKSEGNTKDEFDDDDDEDDCGLIRLTDTLIDFFLGSYHFLTKVNTFLFYIFFSSPQEDKDEKLIDDKNEKSQPINYSIKYDNKFLLLEKIQLTDDYIASLSNNIVMDYTPNGNVIMFFDNNKKSFQYYSDFNIPYSYLESVSKKYCIVNRNSIFRELKMELDVNNEFAIVKNKTTRPQSKSFATLKSYNNASSKPSMGNAIANSSKSQGKPCELKIIQKDIVRYTHLGKLSNYSFLKNTQPRYKKISYKDFEKIK